MNLSRFLFLIALLGLILFSYNIFITVRIVNNIRLVLKQNTGINIKTVGSFIYLILVFYYKF